MPKGLLDQQEVFGFALADGVRRPLLPHDAARDVGQAGDDAIKSAKGTRKKPGPLTKAKEAAREALRKETRAAEKDAALWERVAAVDKAGQSAVAAVLRKPVNLKLPNATVGAKRKRPTAAAAEGAAPAEPPHDELIAAAKKAMAAFDAAKALLASAELGCERAEKRAELASERGRALQASIVYPPKDAFDTEEQWTDRCVMLTARAYADFDADALPDANIAVLKAEMDVAAAKESALAAELDVRRTNIDCRKRQ